MATKTKTSIRKAATRRAVYAKGRYKIYEDKNFTGTGKTVFVVCQHRFGGEYYDGYFEDLANAKRGIDLAERVRLDCVVSRLMGHKGCRIFKS